MDQKTLRKVQLVQLEIAKEIRRVCEEHHIMYFLDGGTLLGAVRHHGFIPWDDDLDLGMLRSEYEKFLKIAPSALNKKYELVTWTSDAGYAHPFCKVMKRNTVYLEEKAQGADAKSGIWVDIFPYDSYPDDNLERKKVVTRLTLYRGMLRIKCKYRMWISNGKTDWKKWLKYLPFRMSSLFFTKTALIKRYEKTAIQYNTRRTQHMMLQGCSPTDTWIIPRSCVTKLTELSFEDEMFRVPEEYDTFLRCGYGNYMELPPVEERGNQHQVIKVDFGESE